MPSFLCTFAKCFATLVMRQYLCARVSMSPASGRYVNSSVKISDFIKTMPQSIDDYTYHSFSSMNAMPHSVDDSAYHSNVALADFADMARVKNNAMNMNWCLTAIGIVFLIIGASCMFVAFVSAFGGYLQAMFSSSAKKESKKGVRFAKDLNADDKVNGKTTGPQLRTQSQVVRVLDGAYSGWDADDTDVKESHLSDSDDSDSDYDAPAKPGKLIESDDEGAKLGDDSVAPKPQCDTGSS
mmetsp:Transcript_67680/g.105798  ORF Transcript_67680/g.105798 Transcript_67680/m.105798 type:complete len:240 (-) Transcript_67680:170-889(-)